MTTTSLYEEEVHCKRLVSALAGKGEEWTTLTEMIKDGGILGAFAQDNDIQQITVSSTNLGMVRRYTKQFKPRTISGEFDAAESD